jgi:hypothetical protein
MDPPDRFAASAAVESGIAGSKVAARRFAQGADIPPSSGDERLVVPSRAARVSSMNWLVDMVSTVSAVITIAAPPKPSERILEQLKPVSIATKVSAFERRTIS